MSASSTPVNLAAARGGVPPHNTSTRCAPSSPASGSSRDAAPCQPSSKTLVETLVPAGALRDTINELAERKQNDREVADGSPLPAFNEFLEAQLSRLAQNTQQLPKADTRDVEELDAFFRATIGYLMD